MNQFLNLTLLFIITATLLPTFSKGYWWIRLFDFPRAHIAVLGLIVILLCIFSSPQIASLLLLPLAIVATLYQLFRVFPFTTLSKVEVSAVEILNVKNSNSKVEIKGLAANVKYNNDNYNLFLKLVAEGNPDIIFLCETSQAWIDNLGELRNKYPNFAEVPREKGTGIALYSKFKILDIKTRYIVADSRPSFTADIEASDEKVFRLYGVHPAPPGLKTDQGGLTGSRPRDAELLIIAKEIEQSKLPTIVVGDFNDAAWSHTTRLFKRQSRMRDPRVGRGFYSTFPASVPLLRMPIDHVFCSKAFKLINIDVSTAFGSDHLAMSFSLSMEDSVEKKTNNLKPGDKSEIKAKIRKGIIKAQTTTEKDR